MELSGSCSGSRSSACPSPASAGSELVEIGFAPLNYAMFASLFLLFGLVLSASMGWLDARLPAPARPVEKVYG